KPYFFDMGTADHMATCQSCHPGGGPVEGIANEEGVIIPYSDPSLAPEHSYDRDFYSYNANDVTMAIFGSQSIAETVANLGDPKPHDWTKSGVVEADCLLCHTDPESPYAYRAADGLKVQTFRPRMMIFAERDENFKVQKISIGMPTKVGLENSTALYYSDNLQRMSRPTPMMALGQLPKENVGEMMQMWVTGLKRIEDNGVNLPFALYGPNIAKIWDESGMIKAAYCANPNGVADEMGRLQESQAGIGMLFQGFLQYMIKNEFLPPDADMDMLMGLFFNDFIYAYQIQFDSDILLPLPYALRAYEPGKFYSDFDCFHSSTRDYIRSGLFEGEGIPYVGKNGTELSATEYAMGLIMGGDYRYVNPETGQLDLSLVIQDMQEGKIPEGEINPVLHDYLPDFFNYMPSGELMGLDFNHDGAPVTYLRIDRDGDNWTPKVFYNLGDIGEDGTLPMAEMFGGSKDRESWKWVKVCGQCHVMTQDHGNSSWTSARRYNIGFAADFVKNGNYVNFTNDSEDRGYDIHMSGKWMGCGSCHMSDNAKALSDKHNILKGVDTAHMVRNDLDANPRVKSCEGCHLAGEGHGNNPSAKHEEVFGDSTGRHLSEVSCQVCHIPYRRTWAFRAFDDTLGYYSNFDNLMGFNILPGGDGAIMAFPSPAYAISPVYSASPGYGIPHFNMIANHIEADGKGIESIDIQSQMVDYFNMNGESDPGQMVNGMPTNFKFDFWKYFLQAGYEGMKAMGVPLEYTDLTDNEFFSPLYYANGINGYPQVVVGNPITVMTWVDTNPQEDADMTDLAFGGARILYLKELNAIISDYKRPTKLGPVSPIDMANIPANDPTWAENPYVGRVILKESGYVLFDHTGDMFPDIWWDEDVKAVQAALKKVLIAEGSKNPNPVLYIAAHYFSGSHGVKPKEKALGSKSCNDCHGSVTKSAGALRVTDRIVSYLPWAPPWFRDENKAMRYDPEHGMVPANPEGLFIVDGEVDYIDVMEANGMRFLGARQKDILKLSHHHAEALFALASEGTVTGDSIFGVDPTLLTQEEQEREYAKQVVNGPWMDKTHCYIPEELKSTKLAGIGFTVGGQEDVYLDGRGFAKAYVLRYELNSGHGEADGHTTVTVPAAIIRLPYTGAEPEIWKLGEHDTFYTPAHDAVIVGHQSAYVLVKVYEPGEYVAVEPNAGGGNQLLYDLWGAFMQ
ncbi:MAG: hypothetical protein KAG92_06685, partial [Deltaproteobacteria bacterium]|nr:hypothetical protein [Deltaproteobacteria bacterium]